LEPGGLERANARDLSGEIANPATLKLISHFQWPVMNSKSARKLTELLIARAFFKLSSIPMEISAPVISLTLVGTREIRMLRGSQSDADTTALFWLELFDHGTRTSIDSFRCDKIEDAAPTFEHMMFQAAGLNGPDAGGDENGCDEGV
jgi:hypothetical protein